MRLAADDQRQFDLPVGLGGALGDDHRIVWPVDRRHRLGEHHRFLGQFHARFLGMVGIVEADGDDLADAGHRRPEARRSFHQRQRLGIEFAQRRQPFGRQHRSVDVRNLVRQGTDASLAVQQARLLRPLRPVTQQFHSFFPLLGWWTVTSSVESGRTRG